MLYKVFYVFPNKYRECAVQDWLREFHLRHTLVIIGDAGLGKSPLALAVAACVAQLHVETNAKGRFHKVSQVEQLPRDELVTGVPIILDEFSPNLPRGHNPAHTIDELKIIFDVPNGGAISGKGSNGRNTGIIEFAALQPRIVTSNAVDPQQFVSILPVNLFMMAPHEIGLVHPDARAIMKRVCFFHVQTNLMSVDVIEEYHGGLTRATSERFERLFGGANALP